MYAQNGVKISQLPPNMYWRDFAAQAEVQQIDEPASVKVNVQLQSVRSKVKLVIQPNNESLLYIVECRPHPVLCNLVV